MKQRKINDKVTVRHPYPYPHRGSIEEINKDCERRGERSVKVRFHDGNFIWAYPNEIGDDIEGYGNYRH